MRNRPGPRRALAFTRRKRQACISGRCCLARRASVVPGREWHARAVTVAVASRADLRSTVRRVAWEGEGVKLLPRSSSGWTAARCVYGLSGRSPGEDPARAYGVTTGPGDAGGPCSRRARATRRVGFGRRVVRGNRFRAGRARDRAARLAISWRARGRTAAGRAAVAAMRCGPVPAVPPGEMAAPARFSRSVTCSVRWPTGSSSSRERRWR